MSDPTFYYDITYGHHDDSPVATPHRVNMATLEKRDPTLAASTKKYFTNANVSNPYRTHDDEGPITVLRVRRAI